MIEGAAPTVAGDLLATRPRGIARTIRGWSLLRHRSLYAHRGWEPDDVLHEARAAQRVAAVWRATRPLTDWIDDQRGSAPSTVGDVRRNVTARPDDDFHRTTSRSCSIRRGEYAPRT